MFSRMLAMVSGEDSSKAGNNSQKSQSARPTTGSTSSGSKASTRPSASSGLTRPLVKTSLSAQEQEEQRKRIERLKAARLGNQPPSKVQKKPPPTVRKKVAPSAAASVQRKAVPAPVAAPAKPPGKKLNYRELMKQAEKVDSEKLKVTVKVKGRDTPAQKVSRPQQEPRVKATTPVPTGPISRKNITPITSSSRSSGPISSASRAKNGLAAPQDAKRPAQGSQVTRQPSKPSTSSSISSARKPLKSKPSERQALPAKPAPRTPAPIAQPMQKLVDKRKKKAESVRKNYYDDDDDESLDDFIVDDEEEEQDDYGRGGRHAGRREEDPGYDKDEIWQMFNRGRRRSDFVNVDDDSSSDMEATGAELYREEQRSLRVAREEDEAEERELKRLAREKLERKNGKRR